MFQSSEIPVDHLRSNRTKKGRCLLHKQKGPKRNTRLRVWECTDTLLKFVLKLALKMVRKNCSSLADELAGQVAQGIRNTFVIIIK